MHIASGCGLPDVVRRCFSACLVDPFVYIASAQSAAGTAGEALNQLGEVHQKPYTALNTVWLFVSPKQDLGCFKQRMQMLPIQVPASS